MTRLLHFLFFCLIFSPNNQIYTLEVIIFFKFLYFFSLKVSLRQGGWYCFLEEDVGSGSAEVALVITVMRHDLHYVDEFTSQFRKLFTFHE